MNRLMSPEIIHCNGCIRSEVEGVLSLIFNHVLLLVYSLKGVTMDCSTMHYVAATYHST